MTLMFICYDLSSLNFVLDGSVLKLLRYLSGGLLLIGKFYGFCLLTHID